MEDIRIVGNENLALEMYVMQLMHVKSIGQEDFTSSINQENISTAKGTNMDLHRDDDDNKVKSVYKNQLKNTEQVKENLAKQPELKSEPIQKNSINTFEDLVKVATNEKEVTLKYDLERNVKLVSFVPGKINITFNEKLNKNFIKILTEKLLKWTGERWIISLSQEEGAKTIYEKTISDKKEKLEEAMKSDVVKKMLSVFPDAKLIDVTKEEDA